MAGADVAITASYRGQLRRVCPGASRVTRRPRSALQCDAGRARCVLGWPTAGRTRPLVAASVGPYGAFLADGSEYRGDYG
ncbi:MAG: homocysteine S-methyltransferase family protein [Caldilineaceae bacterium]